MVLSAILLPVITLSLNIFAYCIAVAIPRLSEPVPALLLVPLDEKLLEDFPPCISTSACVDIPMLIIPPSQFKFNDPTYTSFVTSFTFILIQAPAYTNGLYPIISVSIG